MNIKYKGSLIVILFAIAYIVGIYLDEFTDIVFSTIFTGLFQTQPGSIFNNYECLFVINKLIQRLQVIFINVNMYGIIIVSINSYCIYLTILLFSEKIIPEKFSFFRLSILACIISLLLHDFIFIQFTKTSIYCNFLGCYLLLNDKEKTKTALLLILLGVLLRTETFWFVFVFFIGINLIQQRIQFIQYLQKRKYIWLMIILSASLISYLNKQPYNDDDRCYEIFRKYKYSILDFKQKDSSHSVLSKQNYVKYYSLHNAFFGDTDSLINTDVFVQLNIKQHNRVDFVSFVKTFKYKHNITKAFSNLSNLAYNNRANYIILLSVTLVLIVLLFSFKEFNLFRKVFMVLFFVFIYIFLITCYIKMEDRVLNPILLITLFYLLYNMQNLKSVNKKIHTLSIILILLSELFFLSECYYKLRHRINLRKQSTAFVEKWNQQSINKILVPDLYSLHIFFPKATGETVEVKKIKLFSVDGGYLSMMGNHQHYMYNLVQSNHFKDYILYLIKNKDNVRFLGSDDRIALLQNYIMHIYSINLQFIKIDENTVIDEQGSSGHLQFFLYKLTIP